MLGCIDYVKILHLGTGLTWNTIQINMSVIHKRVCLCVNTLHVYVLELNEEFKRMQHITAPKRKQLLTFTVITCLFDFTEQV